MIITCRRFVAVAGGRRRPACGRVGLLQFWCSVGHGLLSVDDFPKRPFRDLLILTTAIRRIDDPDGFGTGASGRLLDELTSDGAALV